MKKLLLTLLFFLATFSSAQQVSYSTSGDTLLMRYKVNGVGKTVRVYPNMLIGYVDKDSIMTWDDMVDSLGYVKPEQYGALKDDGVSDVLSIQSSIDASDTNIVYFTKGAYNIDTSITLRSNLHLIGNGTIIDGSLLDASEWRFLELGAEPNYGGTATYKALLTADANVGDYTIYTDTTTGINVGDFIRVRSDAYLDGANTYRVAEIAMVYSKTDSSITLDRALFREYLTSDNAVYDIMSLIENVIIEGFTFLGSPTLDADMNGLYFKKGRNVWIKNCTFKNIDRTAIAFYDMIDSGIENCRFLDIRDNGNGYGISLNGACEGISVINNFSRNVKRLVSMGGSIYGSPINTLISNNVIYSRSGGIDTHGGSIGYNIIGNNIVSEYNEVDETRSGITIRGGTFNIIGNTIYALARDSIVYCEGISITNTSSNDFGGVVSGNYIYGGNEDNIAFGTGILLYPTKANRLSEIGITVSNNFLFNLNKGIYVSPDSEYVTNARYLINNNQILGYYELGIQSLYADNILIKNNILKGDTASTSNLYGMYLNQSNNNEVDGNSIELVDFGIRFLESDSSRVKNNRFENITYGFYADTSSHNLIIENNYLKNVPNFKTDSFASDVIIRENEGYTTNNEGVDTLILGNYVVVNHGLDITPSPTNMSVTPFYNTSYWISNVGASTFQINIPEDTTLYGIDQVINGTINDSASWTLTSGWTIVGGEAIGADASGNLYQDISATEDSIYLVTFDAVITSGRLYTDINNGTPSYKTASGNYAIFLIAGATASWGVRFYGGNDPEDFTGTVDNIVVKKVTYIPKILSWQIKD